MQIKFSAEPTGDAIAYLAYEGDKGVEFAAALDKAAETAIRRAVAAGSFKGGAGQVIEGELGRAAHIDITHDDEFTAWQEYNENSVSKRRRNAFLKHWGAGTRDIAKFYQNLHA